MTDIYTSAERERLERRERAEAAYAAMNVLKQEVAQIFQRHFIEHPEIGETFHLDFDKLFRSVTWKALGKSNELAIERYKKDIEKTVCEGLADESPFMEKLVEDFYQITLHSDEEIDEESAKKFIKSLIASPERYTENIFNAFINRLIAARYFYQIEEKEAHKMISKIKFGEDQKEQETPHD